MEYRNKKSSRYEAGLEVGSHQAKRRHLESTTQIIRFLDSMKPETKLHEKHHRRDQQIRLRRVFSISQQAIVIHLRFGCLSDDSQPWMTPAEVFRRTGIISGSQFNIIKRWRERGFEITSHLSKRGKRMIISEEQQLFLAYPKTLLEWSHLSLHQRAALVREQFNLGSISHQSMAEYYHRLGVRYRKPHYVYSYKDRHQREVFEGQQEVS